MTEPDAACKALIGQVLADLIAVGEIVRLAYGEAASAQLFASAKALEARFKVAPAVGRVDVHAELARRQEWRRMVNYIL